jgi:hypothetical protein
MQYSSKLQINISSDLNGVNTYQLANNINLTIRFIVQLQFEWGKHISMSQNISNLTCKLTIHNSTIVCNASTHGTAPHNLLR